MRTIDVDGADSGRRCTSRIVRIFLNKTQKKKKIVPVDFYLHLLDISFSSFEHFMSLNVYDSFCTRQKKKMILRHLKAYPCYLAIFFRWQTQSLP